MKAMSPARWFQYYCDNFFKFPKEIKNDIVYCQRALRAHIKVHQMVLDVFQQQKDGDPRQKKRILDEIETEIFEINAEQHFLLLRLRRIIEEFNKILRKNGIPMDHNATNMIISKEVVPLVIDTSVEFLPVSVNFRNTEEKLIQKYFEVQKDRKKKKVYEIIDSDEDAPMVIDEGLEIKQEIKPNLSNENLLANDYNLAAAKNGHPNSRMSLLKPMSQRMVGLSGAGGGEILPETSVVLPLSMDIDDEKSKIKLEPAIEQSAPAIAGKPPVSKTFEMSRLNLRQALKKARTNMAKAAAARAPIVQPNTVPAAIIAPTPAPALALLSPPSPPPAVSVALPAASKKAESKTRATRGSAAVAAAAIAKANEMNSSSEDSNPERGLTPPHTSNWPSDPEEYKTQPEHYGQEMFLRLFRLFTPEMHVQMAQRRSKRKRRTVHNNERADFHYGRIEYGSLPAVTDDHKKKRKEFLLSPQVKRGLQTKRRKRRSAEKIDEVVPSRSSSSSPDEKRGCNECLKGGGCLDQCGECKGFYHQSCHREEDEEKPMTTKRALPANKLKLCPACKRIKMQLLKKETQQFKALHSTAQELEEKMAKEKDRRASLQKASKLYKIQMNNLFNIVNTIKSDHENDSSE